MGKKDLATIKSSQWQTGDSSTLVARTKRFAKWCLCADDGSQRSTINVQLTRAEVVATLSPLVKRNLFGKYRGNVTDTTFRIALNHIWYHNSWSPELCGKIDEDLNGCIITYYFDITQGTKIFMSLWMAGAVVISLGAIIQAIMRGWTQADFVPLSFPLFGLLLPRTGQLLGKPDQLKLLDVLERIKKVSLGIKPVEP